MNCRSIASISPFDFLTASRIFMKKTYLLTRIYIYKTNFLFFLTENFLIEQMTLIMTLKMSIHKSTILLIKPFLKINNFNENMIYIIIKIILI